ncbi:aminotransferase class V-fold PLP-dependent enzyme [Massilia glaciei]|nr:aminotransferase class V-fold PLP-dependent enzyme [Massilia glaciei]
MVDMHQTRRPDDEPYWSSLRDAFQKAPDRINLENGYFGTQATSVFEAWQRLERQIHLENSYFLRVRKPALMTAAIARLAEFSGCDPSELLVTRNVIEALNIVIQGYPFAAGDEVVVASHDYDEVVEILQMVSERKGLTLRRVVIPLDPQSDDEIVDVYRRAIAPRTRVLLLTHVVPRTGQIMPVQKISAMAREFGVETIVDAAHSYAHLDFKVSELGADFVGVNLHKWLGAPLGVGMLYIRHARIADISPLYGDVKHAVTTMAKLGNFGTVPPGPILAIPDAIAFHLAIGSANKEARLRYLKQYWLTRVRGLRNVRSLTPADPNRSCAIATFSINGMPSSEVVRRLLCEHAIFTVVRNVDGHEGVRVTPNLSTSIAELDLLVGAITTLADTQIPATVVR